MMSLPEQRKSKGIFVSERVVDEIKPIHVVHNTLRSSSEKDLDLRNLQSMSFMIAASKEFRAKENLILGAERTFFAAMNNAWLLVFAGVGLMTVSRNDQAARSAGGAITIAGMVAFLLALFMHVQRLWHPKFDKPFPYSHSVAWATVLALIAMSALGFELHFANLYPYLDRGVAAVVVQNNV